VSGKVRQRHGNLDATTPRNAASETIWLEAELDTVEENLALDEALLEQAHEGLAAGAVVRTWMAREPVVVVGSSSRLDEEVDRAACAAERVRIVRRPSGGLTVVLGPGCLMWSVVSPHPEGAPPIDRIHADMLEPLRSTLGAKLAQTGIAVDRRGSSDLVAVKESLALKFSGNALRVRRHGVLYHGTLLDAFDIPLISRVLRHPPREPDYRGRRPHGEFLANLNLGRATLETIVRQAFRAAATRHDWPRDRVERLVSERYGRADWTHRL
jgi:lipoate-protein ligase A